MFIDTVISTDENDDSYFIQPIFFFPISFHPNPIRFINIPTRYISVIRYDNEYRVSLQY